jgi:hypothetical protein
VKKLLWIRATVCISLLALGRACPARGDLAVTATLLPAREATGSPAGPTSHDKTYLYVRHGAEMTALEFDLAAIPPKARIVHCYLRLAADDVPWKPEGDASSLDQFQDLIASELTPAEWPEDEGAVKAAPAWKQPDPKDRSVVALSRLRGDTEPKRLVALNRVDTSLRGKVQDIVDGKVPDRRLRLRVYSVNNSSSRLYSSQTTEYNKRPRLVVQFDWQPTLASEVAWRQYQFGPEHTAFCPVFQYPRPQGYAPDFIELPPPDSKTTLEIRTHPVVYDNQIFLVVHQSPQGNDLLYALSYPGAVLWKETLTHAGSPPVGQKQPGVSLDGILYQSWKPKVDAPLDAIVGYDLKQRGREVCSLPATSLQATDISELTVGNDGSLFFAAVVAGQTVGARVYGLTRTGNTLKPFLQFGVPARGADPVVPRGVSISHDGRWLYASADVDRPNGRGGLYVIDLINPPIDRVDPLEDGLMINTDKKEPLYASQDTLPVALPEAGASAISTLPKVATSSPAGVNVLQLRLGADNVPSVAIFWQEKGKTPEPPALGEPFGLCFIQSGGLRCRSIRVHDTALFSANEKDLQVMSNLVIDGNDRLSFWSGSTYRAFGYTAVKDEMGKDKTVISETTRKAPDSIKFPVGRKPEAALRWIIGPDGTRYAQSGSYLFLLRPTCNQKDRDETLVQAQLTRRHQTVLAPVKMVASGALNIGVAIVPDKEFTSDLIVESTKGFNVPVGARLTVKQGATMSVRIAPDLAKTAR